ADRTGARTYAAEYNELVQRAFGSAERSEWLQRLSAAGIPAAPVQTVDEALAHPQFVERDAIGEVENVDGATEQSPLSPFQFDGRRHTD
ncbi:CoA transferase, partial [Klebsiella pneumoniae]|nr:CoA transferase [Klebsiella pneumoniae]